MFTLSRLTQVVCSPLIAVVMKGTVMIAIASVTCSTPIAGVEFSFLKLYDSLKLNHSACPLLIYLQDMQIGLDHLLTAL